MNFCIPRVDGSVTESQIKKTLDRIQLGVIDRITIVTKTNKQGIKTRRAFISLKQWHDSGNAAIARERFEKGLDIKIVYNEPWYWKMSMSRDK